MRRLIINSYRFAVGAALLASMLVSGQVQASAEIYQKAMRSTVWVRRIEGNVVHMGTGVLVDKAKKLVVTNHHVVGEADTVQVFFPRYRDGLAVSDPKEYLKDVKTDGISAEVLVRSEGHDLALLELAKVPDGVEAMPLASASPTPGEAVHAIGNSGVNDGVLWRYSTGFVRQVYVVEEKGLAFRARVVETQIPVNHGDSGGPMVNDRGQLVAVTRYFDQRSNLVSGGVDVNEIKELLRTPKEVKLPVKTNIAGTWKATREEEGKEVEITLTLKTNGKFVLKGTVLGEPLVIDGSYTFKDSVLVLNPADGDALRGTVKRAGDTEFTWTIDEDHVQHFTRQK